MRFAVNPPGLKTRSEDAGPEAKLKEGQKNQERAIRIQKRLAKILEDSIFMC
jgi:hypothetical protein